MIRTAAIITASEAEPRKYGKQIVLGGMLDHLCDRLGPSNVHLVQIGRLDAKRPRVAYRRHVIAKPPALSQLRAVLGHVVLPRVGFPGDRISLQEAALRSPDIERALGRLIEDIDPDLEIWDTVRLGQYARALPVRAHVRRLLYADDLFSERYNAMLREGETRGLSGNPGGEFKKLLPRPVRRLLGDPRVYRPLMKLERQLVAEAEERQPHWFDATYLVGPAEAERLRARCPGPTIGSLPPLLSEPHARHRSAPKAPVFTFLGGFDYAPNLDGLGWFLEFCRDAVLAVLPHVQIRVVGSGTERG